MPGPTSANQLALADAATKLLARESRGGLGTGHVAPDAVRACQKLSVHLERLVGRHGTAALFARSLAVTRRRFPWLVVTAADVSGDPWPALLVCLEARDGDLAHQASVSLLASFVELLGRLIGEAMVLVLLAEIWPEDFPMPTPTEETP